MHGRNAVDVLLYDTMNELSCLGYVHLIHRVWNKLGALSLTCIRNLLEIYIVEIHHYVTKE